jgi:hypothetical protein
MCSVAAGGNHAAAGTSSQRKSSGNEPQSVGNPVYADLIAADDGGDARALARVAWSLFALASDVCEAHREAIAVLDELCTAARAATAGNGSPASLAVLRAVLAKRGWLPPPSATPLQVLASPGISPVAGSRAFTHQ